MCNNCGSNQNSSVCNCKTQGANGTSVDVIDSSTVLVRSDLPTEIVAGTNVTVTQATIPTPDGKNKKLVYTVNATCCPTKIKVCPQSTGSEYLSNIIEVSGGILKSNYDCVNNKLVLSLDVSKIPYEDVPDEKVKWSLICESKYLSDIIGLTNHFAWYTGVDATTALEIEDPSAYCDKMYLGPKCDECTGKSVCQLVLKKDFIVRQPVNFALNPSKFYVMVDSSISGQFFPGLSVTSVDKDGQSASWLEKINYGSLSVDTLGNICNSCNSPRLVRVRLSGSLEATWGCNGVRVQVYKSNGSTGGTYSEPVAEWRSSPPSDPDVDGDGLPDNYNTTAGGSSGSNQGYKYMERWGFNAERIVLLKAGECLIPVFKVSSKIQDPSYDVTRDAEVALLGTSSNDGTVTGDLGVTFEVETIDDYCIQKQIKIECGC